MKVYNYQSESVNSLEESLRDVYTSLSSGFPQSELSTDHAPGHIVSVHRGAWPSVERSGVDCGKALRLCELCHKTFEDDPDFIHECTNEDENESGQGVPECPHGSPPVERKKVAACLTHIKEHNKSLSYCNHYDSHFQEIPLEDTPLPEVEYFKKTPRRTILPTDVTIFPKMIVLKADYGDITNKGKSGAGKKSTITEFTTRSRNNLLRTIGQFPHDWSFRQELTFADDVMEGKTKTERAEEAKRVLHAFQVWKKRHYPEVQSLWKKEWEPRKSGVLKGESLPHLHFLLFCPGYTVDQYYDYCVNAAIRWVKLTKSTHDRAYQVALHNNSMGPLKKNDKYTEYFPKYVTKERFEVSEDGKESIGRFWGKLGDVDQAEGKKLSMNTEQVVKLKRIERGFLRSTQKYIKKLADGTRVQKKSKRQYEKSVRRNTFSGFVMMKEETIYRALEYVGTAVDRDGWDLQ